MSSLGAEATAPRGSVVCHAVVLAERGQRFLALRGERGWSLPRVEVPPGNWYDVKPVVDSLLAEHGLRVFVLRCVAGSSNVRPSSERVYECAPLGAPAAAETWLDSDDDHLLEDAAQRNALNACLRLAPAAEPWSRPGWIDEVRSFVADATGTPVPALRQLRTWQRSCVIRVEVSPEPLIFKAVPPVYSHEPALAHWLARRFARQFPEVTACDHERGWMLMEELHGRPLHRVRETEPWCRALTSFAQIQRQCITATAELVALGLPDLRIGILRARTAELLADREAMMPGEPDGLRDAEIATLSRCAARIDTLWEQLDDYGLPASLEHGDFRPEHVMVRSGEVAFFDVSSGSVSHPFFSAVTMLDFEDLPSGDPHTGTEAAVRAKLRSAYLQPWTATYGEAALADAFEAARPLAILHAAITRRPLVSSFEPRDDWAFMIPYWLRKLLRSLETAELRR